MRTPTNALSASTQLPRRRSASVRRSASARSELRERAPRCKFCCARCDSLRLRCCEAVFSAAVALFSETYPRSYLLRWSFSFIFAFFHALLKTMGVFWSPTRSWHSPGWSMCHVLPYRVVSQILHSTIFFSLAGAVSGPCFFTGTLYRKGLQWSAARGQRSTVIPQL